ncbi:MAG: hypothetical protein ACYCY1_01405 [Sulfuriferula sp.]
MITTRRLITTLLMSTGLFVGLTSLAQAHDDDGGRVGFSFSVGAPAYYGPPAYVYTPPPRVYYQQPPQVYYYGNSYENWHPREHWRGRDRGHWRHHEHDDDD